MLLSRCFLLVLLATGSALAGTRENIVLPSDPASWNADLFRLIQPTEKCAGGTVEQLGKRVFLSHPYSPQEFEASHPGTLLSIHGLADSDRIYSFYFRSELPGVSFWGFGGDLIARGECIIYADVTTYDN